MIAELRARHGTPFHIAVAVSPFKYVREDCLYQYLKLEKKIAAGADLRDHPGRLGCAQVPRAEALSGRARAADADARQRLRAEPARRGEDGQGAAARDAGRRRSWSSRFVRSRRRPDGGLDARLERAAQTVAVLKGLGYAGAYLGGTHDVRQITRIIRRAEELAPRLGSAGRSAAVRQRGRVLSGRGAAAASGRCRSFPSRWTRWAGRCRCRGRKSRRTPGLRRQIRAFFAWADRRGLDGLVERFEYIVKRPAFGCEECGNCVLGHMEYVCPQTCPKQMRNGPVRRHVPGPVRGRGQAVHLGEGDGTGRGHQQPRRAQDLHSAARSPAQGHELLDQLLPRTRQPAGGVVLRLGSVAAGHAGAPGHAAYVVSRLQADRVHGRRSGPQNRFTGSRTGHGAVALSFRLCFGLGDARQLYMRPTVAYDDAPCRPRDSPPHRRQKR